MLLKIVFFYKGIVKYIYILNYLKMKKILFTLFVAFWFVVTWNIFAWKVSYHKNSFWSTDVIAYLCDNSIYWKCNEREAIYTVWIKYDELFWETTTTYYYCKWWVYECNNRNSFWSDKYSSSSY